MSSKVVSAGMEYERRASAIRHWTSCRGVSNFGSPSAGVARLVGRASRGCGSWCPGGRVAMRNSSSMPKVRAGMAFQWWKVDMFVMVVLCG